MIRVTLLLRRGVGVHIYASEVVDICRPLGTYVRNLVHVCHGDLHSTRFTLELCFPYLAENTLKCRVGLNKMMGTRGDRGVPINARGMVCMDLQRRTDRVWSMKGGYGRGRAKYAVGGKEGCGGGRRG